MSELACGCTINDLLKSTAGDTNLFKPLELAVSYWSDFEHQVDKIPRPDHHHSGSCPDHKLHRYYNRRVIEQLRRFWCFILRSPGDLDDAVCRLLQLLPHLHLHCLNQRRTGLRVSQQPRLGYDYAAMWPQSKYFKCAISGVKQAKRQVFRPKKRGDTGLQEFVHYSTDWLKFRDRPKCWGSQHRTVLSAR